MSEWLYFQDESIAVRLDHYQKNRDQYEGMKVAYVLDTETGERSQGAPKAPAKAAKSEKSPE